MQAAIRTRGAGAMERESYDRFVTLHEANDLLPPDKPGRAIAALALRASHDMSGGIYRWDDEAVQSLLA